MVERSEGNMENSSGIEQRRHPRLYEPFPTQVHGVDAGGEAFDINTVLDNLSAGGARGAPA